MILVRAILPFLYCIAISSGYSLCFNKRVLNSLAPSFGIHILIMLFTAMVFDSISLGLYLGVGLSLIVAACICIRSHSLERLFDKYRLNSENIGFYIFAVLYVLVFVLNYGKHFSKWDEFSHWGIFVKEMFRTDMLYCTSPATMAHKDYVPAISIFETLWCRLALRYSEAECYRGIQVLELSMMLPMATEIIKKASKMTTGKKMFLAICNSLVVVIVPLYFGLPFYHTIYQDLIYGVLVFYCMWLILANEFSLILVFEEAVALTILVLSKMTAMAFLPMIVLFFVVYYIRNDRANKKNALISGAALLALPTSAWALFNKYAGMYVDSSNSNQSYSGISVGRLLGAILHDGSISYQAVVEKKYLAALFKEHVFGRISYFWIVIAIVIALLAFSKVANDERKRKDIRLVSLWVVLAAIAYAFMMWYLYLSAFSEYEATSLASFARYMGSFVMAAVLIAISVWYTYGEPKLIWVNYVLAIITVQNAVMLINPSQLISGITQKDTVMWEGETEYVMNNVPEDASIYVITRGGTGMFPVYMSYYCAPRRFYWSSPGPAFDEDDIYSIDMSLEEFVREVDKCDYIYFKDIDQDFIDIYSEAFADPSIIVTGKLYRIEGKGNKLARAD